MHEILDERNCGTYGWRRSKRLREHQPEQMLLLPPSLQDWLPEGHLARFSSDVVAELDRSAL